ncbi:CHAT domain-containing protein [Paraburkholderia sp. MM5384-R2]|uniref:CHAT domain-containing protein n=1 Tax=Paraburkholderia sp. MM5384-R2 TaxID=2723097 RepID=UPI00161069A4|nr:CHAT domain-containing protein [Paraburkholderia sp. MM5384-R2]MBB5498630.1 hypothetical protein [Paraburkholderia sp. MM5384-R2]
MQNSIRFLEQVFENLAQLRELVGDDWPKFKKTLLALLEEIVSTEDDKSLVLRVNRVFRSFRGTHAETHIKTLLAKSLEGIERSDLPNGVRQHLSRALEEDREHCGRVEGNGRKEDLVAIARDLIEAIALTSDDVISPTVDSLANDVNSVTSYPHIIGDDHGYVDTAYRLDVKLSDQPQQEGPHLSAPGLAVLVEPGKAIVKVQIRLVAPDFGLDETHNADGWTREVNFYPEARASGACTFVLRPRDRMEARYFSTLRVHFLLDGQLLGYAVRRVEVLSNEAVAPTLLGAFPPVPGYPLDERGVTRSPPVLTPVAVRTDLPPVDFTITISEVDPQQLLWQIDSPHLAATDVGAEPLLTRNLGAEEFVRQYLAPFGMPGEWPEDHMDTDGNLKPLSVNALYSNLLMLRNCAPRRFWMLYETALGRYTSTGAESEAFSILLITADTHIPWELMPVSEKVVDDAMPLLLGSAHRVGRWLLETGTSVPDARLDLKGFVVAAPTYDESPLPQAQQERQFLSTKFQAFELPDNANDFIKFMRTGAPTEGAGILHFAGHGDCCTDAIRRNWLVLTNRTALYDINSASTDLGNQLGKLRPVFAFFNACNVGRAAKGPLGSNGGWGRALLGQRYRGYVGPLWSVYDRHARDIAETFYTLAISEQRPLGEVMQRIRAKFSSNNRLFTYLAYLYLGHPLAKLEYEPFDGVTAHGTTTSSP